MFVEPSGTEARFMYKINRAGEVSHHSDVCTNYVALSQAVLEHSTHLVLLWRTCCWLSLALLSMELSAAAEMGTSHQSACLGCPKPLGT